LKGRTSIRAELLAHSQYIQQLPAIQNLLYLGRKGRTQQQSKPMRKIC